MGDDIAVARGDRLIDARRARSPHMTTEESATTEEPAPPPEGPPPEGPPSEGPPSARTSERGDLDPDGPQPAAQPSSPDPGAAPRRPATSLLAWGTVALVLVIVIVLVVIKITGGPVVPTPTSAPAPTPAPPAVVKAVTSIPASVYDAVGVKSTDAALTPPTLLRGQPDLTSAGKPEIVFVGDEFSPYCAAERWALVAALSRFGTFGTTLDAMQSGSAEVFPGTPTFTFVDTHYRSRYLSALLVEHYGNKKNSAGTAYSVLEPLTAEVKALLTRYGRTTPGSAAPVVPFVDVANRAIVAGGEFSPAVLQQLGANDIAAGLTDPHAPATQAIVAAANYLSATICEADGEQPSRVCTSTGVRAARRALGLPG